MKQLFLGEFRGIWVALGDRGVKVAKFSNLITRKYKSPYTYLNSLTFDEHDHYSL